MPLITSAGIGSGLDLESIIKASVDAERLPKLQSLAVRQESLQVELSALGEVRSAMSQLEGTIAKLADMDNFNKREATIKQPDIGDIISVTTGTDISPGSFKVQVDQLAQGSRAESTPGAFTSVDDVVTASGGTLSFSAGSKTFDITLDAGATLADLRTAINESSENFGVSANIINTGTESRLVFTSSETGAGNDLVVTNDTAELDAVSTQANGGGAGGMTIAAGDEAQDAQITVDDIVITSATNTFKDAVEGMTITAKEESLGETATINVDYDKSGVEEVIDEFIANYNNLVGMLGLQTRIGKPLNGDATIRSFSGQMLTTLSTPLTDTGPFASIFDIGLTVDKDGYLEKSSLVNSLSDSLSENFDEVGKAFAGDNGIAKQFETLLDNYIDTNGVIKQRETSLNLQLDDLDDDRANLDYRMTQYEERLRKQYSSLDVLLAQMQQTQSYLSAQLSSLPGFGGKKA